MDTSLRFYYPSLLRRGRLSQEAFANTAAKSTIIGTFIISRKYHFFIATIIYEARKFMTPHRVELSSIVLTGLIICTFGDSSILLIIQTMEGKFLQSQRCLR